MSDCRSSHENCDAEDDDYLFRHRSMDGAAVKIGRDPVPDADAHGLTVAYSDDLDWPSATSSF
jgi:hypothetical protein